MKRIFVSLILLVFLTSVYCQENYNHAGIQKDKKVFFSPQIGFGFFHPDDVNNYISNQYSNYATEVGTTDMIMYFHVGVNAAFFPARFLELQAGIECVGGPKFIVADDADYYSLNRITPNAKVNFHIPTGKKASIILGTGLSYSRVKFKTPEAKITGNDIGYSLQTGVMIRFRKFAYAPTLVFNNIVAEANSNEGGEVYDDWGNYVGVYSATMDLSYVGVQISNIFYF